MPVLGITGGIATGKSLFTRLLHAQLPGEVFDADAAAHDLLHHDEGVQAALREHFGEGIFNTAGELQRPALREQAFASSGQRAVLEGILHPAIRQRWLRQAEAYTTSPAWLLVDIPLLYETRADTHLPRVIVVACSAATQQHRLREKRGMMPAMTEKIIGAQAELSFKVSRAHHVVWNDSTLACLERQAQLLAGWLCKHYG